VEDNAMKLMQHSLGPWTTSLDSGSRLELSAFWRRRMNSLPELSEASHLSRWSIWKIVAPVALTMALTPQFHFVPSLAIADKPPATDDSVSRLQYRAKPLNEDEQKLLAVWRKKSAAAAKKLLETGHYSLKAGELARFVPASVGGEVRSEFANINDHGRERVSFVMRVEGGQLNSTMSHFDDMTLSETLDWLLGIKLHRIKGEDSLVDLPMPEGDWVFASYDPNERKQVTAAIVEAIEETLSETLEQPLSFEWRETERPALVARGDYRFTAIPGEDGKVEVVSERVGERADGTFFYPARRGSTIQSVGRFDQMLEDVGELLLTPIVDEVAAPPKKSDFFWSFPRKPLFNSREPLDAATATVVRDSFTKQTGLELTDEIRPVKILFITREAAAEGSR
jgi:hypothetical protein